MDKLIQILKKNITILLNTGSLVGTAAITSGLGFAYWVVAARLFTVSAVGVAELMNSMMTLLGNIAMLGLGTLLTGELTRRPGKEWGLINAALIVTGGAGIVAGVIFAFIVPFVSPNLDEIGANGFNISLFALGVGFTTLTSVLDLALIGILRGGVQLSRNAVFAVVKLAALIASFFFFQKSGMTIYVTWLIGNVVSLVVLLQRSSKKTAHEASGEMAVANSLSQALSGPLLALSGPLTNIERSLRIPCPDCGTLSSNSASYCLNCGYPFSPTVEISSVRPQLFFDYGTIGLSESSMFKKRKSTSSNNVCPECGNASPDYAMYCATCGYPLTPTIEMPSLKTGLSKLEIEAQDTLPLLAAIQREKAQQALSAESTMLISSPVRNAQRPAALQRTPLPIDAEETLIANLPRTPRIVENEQKPNSLEQKRSALFGEDEKTLGMPNLPNTPLTRTANNTPLPQKIEEAKQKSKESSAKPEWGLLRKLGKAAIQHHILNLMLLSPSLILPLLVTIQLSATENAYFSVAFQLATFIFTLTYSLTVVLHAVSSAQPSVLAQKIRFTLALSFAASLAANIVLQPGAGLLLSLFNKEYVGGAATCLRILSLAAFPIVIKSHFLAINRVYDRTLKIVIPITIGGILELGLAMAGAHFDELTGLSLGWVIALTLEALYMAYTVYRAANPINVNIPAGASKQAAKA